MSNTLIRLTLVLSTAIAIGSASFCATAATTPVPPPMLCIDNNCVSTASNLTSASAIKWHPGHYSALGGLIFDAAWLSTFNAEIDAICSNRNIKGVQLSKSWAALEGPRKGDYSTGFSYIDRVLTKLKTCNKHLMLKVWERNFGSPQTRPASETRWSWLIPQYIMSDPAYGNDSAPYGIVQAPVGTTYTGAGIVYARLWEAPVMDRLIALAQAYGARYNNNPYFEMYSMEETAIPVPTSQGYSSSAHDVQLRRWLTATSNAMPSTIVRLNANFLLNADTLFGLCAALPNCGVGGPDPELPLPTITRTITANQVFRGIGGTDRRGVIPWIGEQQGLGLTVRYFETPKEINAYQNATMHNSYMIWTKNEAWTSVLAEINASSGSVFLTKCPSRFASCNTN